MKSISFLPIALLAGCSFFGEPEVQTKYIPQVVDPPPIRCGAEPKPGELSLLEVKPSACDGPEGAKFVCIPPKHYENLSVNMQALLARIEQGNIVVDFYRECLREHNDYLKSTQEPTEEGQ